MDSRVTLVLAAIAAIVALALTVYTLREPMTPAATTKPPVTGLTGASKQTLEKSVVYMVTAQYTKAVEDKDKKSGGAKPLCAAIVAAARANVAAAIKSNGLTPALAAAANKVCDELDAHIVKAHCTASANPSVVNVPLLKTQIAEVAKLTKV